MIRSSLEEQRVWKVGKLKYEKSQKLEIRTFGNERIGKLEDFENPRHR